MHAVLVTPVFERQAKAAGVDEAEVDEMIACLAANPRAGAVMKGTGGARKVRFAGKQGGKSGAYRTIHYFGGDDVPVFLLGLIDKGKQDNLSDEQKARLADRLPKLADTYRTFAARRAAEMNKGGH